MELYLNKIFFGHRAYGISAAAELYYGKTWIS
jgi:penicillin-binding protein 1A